MKLLIFSLFSTLFALNGLSADKQLRAYLDNKQFYAPGVGNYVEFHLQFVGRSVEYQGKDNGLIGTLAVRIELKKNGEIVRSDAYQLMTPFMKDSIVEDFYDIKRFTLEPGEYSLFIELQDLNSSAEPLSVSHLILVEDFSDAISISDIEVAEIATIGTEDSPFYKSGYTIIPRLSTFYPQELSTLPVYFEVYNSNELEDSIFAIKQTVVDAKTGLELEELTQFSRHSSSLVVPILRKINLENVPTGKYITSFTIYNRNMIELSSQSYIFERSNDLENNMSTANLVLDPNFQTSITRDSVGYYLESLIPISRANGVRNIIALSKEKNELEARKYIQMFWSMTAPDNAYEGWMKYKAQVQLVERSFANNFQEGFETDRGRVYLQYGAPTNIIPNHNSMVEYPHEIWQYNKIGKFSNKRFIFYNPDLTNNAFRLLHSDMVGELKNPSWPHELSKRNTLPGNVDNPNSNVQDSFGRNAQEDFR